MVVARICGSERPGHGVRPYAIAKCRVGLHGHLHHATIVGGGGCIEWMHVTALCRVILRHVREFWARGVLNGDGLRGRRAVATFIHGGECPRHHVTVRTAVSGVSHFRNGHHATIVCGRCRLQGMSIAALCGVIRRNHQLGISGVLDGDGLGGRHAVAAFIHGSEGPCHHVTVGTTVSRVGHFRNGHHAAVVCGCCRIQWVLVTALSGVIHRNRQLGSRSVLNGDGLGCRCDVPAVIRCREGSRHHISVGATVGGVRRFFQGHHATVVRGCGHVQWMCIAALCSVIRRNGQLRCRGVLNLNGLFMRGRVAAIVADRPRTGDRVGVGTVSACDGRRRKDRHVLTIVGRSEHGHFWHLIAFNSHVHRQRLVERRCCGVLDGDGLGR